MPDNSIYGVDFIARCMAGEALEKAGNSGWTLVAGNNISIQSDEEQKTETISATYEVDDALSTTSTNAVENRVVTGALRTKPTSVNLDGTVRNDQKIMQLTRQQYNALQNKDPDTYYMVTDDPTPSAPIVARTAYVPLTSQEYTTSNQGTHYLINFDAPAGFELLEARISYRITLTNGWFEDATLTFTDTLSIPSSESSTPREGRKIYTEMLKDEWIGEAPDQVHINKTMTSLIGANFIRYDSQTGKIQLEIGNFTAGYYSYVEGYPENIDPTVITNLEILSLGYIAYGPNNINITTGLTAGTGIDITNDEISIDMPVGSEIGMTIDPSTYVLTVTLYDQNTTPINTATVDLPLESMVVSGTYDSTTEEIVLTLQSGQTIRFSVASLVSGLETSAHAAATYQTQAGMSNYLTTSAASSTYQPIGSYATTNDISDMATETWVGQQGYLTSADEVPDVTSNDDGKVLKATYSGGTGSYAWATPQSFSQEQSDWTENDNTKVSFIKNKPNLATVATSGSYSDLSNTPTLGTAAAASTSDFATAAQGALADTAVQPADLATVATSGSYADLSNKPTIPAAQVNADWNSSSGVSEILNKPNLATVATSGSYNDLSNKPTIPAAQIQADWDQTNNQALDYIKNKPTIPAAQVNSDWSAVSGVSQILNKPDLSVYLTSSDLSGYATETWVNNNVDEVPSVGSSDDGKVLTASYSGGTGSYSWVTPSSGGTSDYTDLTNKPSINNVTLSGNKTTSDLGIDEVPAVGSTDDGKVLTAIYSGGAGSFAWATPSSGGLQVETDGTNYWITVNGIRLYFASSAPTGTIPNGSIGIGW